MSHRPIAPHLTRRATYPHLVCLAIILILTGALVARLPITDTVVRAAASFLSSVTHDATLNGDGTTALPLGIATNGVGNTQLANNSVTATKIASGQVVKNINGMSDGVTLAAGSNVSLALSGQTLTISSLLGLTSVAHDATLMGNGTNLSPLGIADASITSEQIAGGAVVRELNNLKDSITLVGGSNVTITPAENNKLLISANSVNLRRIATLQWYEAIQTGFSYTLPLGAKNMVFDGVNLWISNLTNLVSKVSPTDGTVLGTFNSQQGSADGMAFDGTNVWIACGDDGVVAKLRASDGVRLGVFDVPLYPRKVAFDGMNVWVVGNGYVTKFRASDGTRLGSYNIGNNPYGSDIAFDGANMWILSEGGVTKIRANDDVVLGTFAIGSSPTAIAFDGANVWITDRFGNSVTKLRTVDGANLGAFAVGSEPFGIAFDGSSIWVTNSVSNSVTKLRASDGSLLGTFTVGSEPFGIAFDGTNVWVANIISRSITKL